jgi:hypothetical protein
LDTIFDPVKLHVNDFGAVLFDNVVGDNSSTGVVGLNGHGVLWAPHFGKFGSEGSCVFCSASVTEGEDGRLVIFLPSSKFSNQRVKSNNLFSSSYTKG